jgi:hypothetical protein
MKKKTMQLRYLGEIESKLARGALCKDYYIDGQNTPLIFFEKISTGGGKKTPQITPRGWIFWTMIFYNL